MKSNVLVDELWGYFNIKKIEATGEPIKSVETDFIY